MGIYDRDYATVRDTSRQEHGGFRSLVGGHSTLTVLIALNVAVFVLWTITGDARRLVEEAGTLGDVNYNRFLMWKHFTVSLEGVLEQYRLHTLVTAAFSHFEPWHLLFNMLFLWWLGRDLETIYGSRDFLMLYLLAGVVSSASHLAMKATLPEYLHAPALGASGSVMGILVCCAFFFPDREIYFFGLFPIKLKWLTVIYVAVDMHSVFFGAMDGIGHAAHLGGALMGFLYYKYDLRLFPIDGSPRFAPLRALSNLFRRRPRLRVVERATPGSVVEEPLSRSASARLGRVDADTAARVDSLLKKISEQGMGALTPEERRFLESSSEKYKR